jgi:peptidoglycan/LPS O-acetylase OafA/YrhL
MRLLGMLSYSLYLLHTPVIHGVQQWIHAPALAQGSLAMIICFLGALGMFYAVEMPSARLRKRLTARPDRSQGSGTSIPTGSSMAPEGSSVL